MACCIGAAAAGVRTFTATSGQGLALMHEMLHWASGARLPIVMATVNRALGSPWNIWGEQTDALAQRDTGWLQFYCENNQEVLDTTIQAFKIAEEILLPVMLNLDAFFLSHTAEPVEIPEQRLVDSFLPRFEAPYRLDPQDPHSFGCLTTPDYFMEFRYKIQQAMLKGKEVSKRVDEDFGRAFGRKYGLIDAYRCEGADLILVASGTIASTARVVVDALREKGRKVGVVKVRLFRPFPKEELLEVVKDAEKVAVVDRNVSFGVGGIFAHELRAAFCNDKARPLVFSYIAGLGGRDVTPQVLNDVVYQTYKKSEPDEQSVWVGMRS
jgi:pyruvate/2-oxoacid:ferredoxin oxidoreductase alpha subunit